MKVVMGGMLLVLTDRKCNPLPDCSGPWSWSQWWGWVTHPALIYHVWDNNILGHPVMFIISINTLKLLMK